MVDGLNELSAALLLQAVELEQNAPGLRDGHEHDDKGLELLRAGTGAQGVKVALGRASAGTSATPSTTLRAGARHC